MNDLARKYVETQDKKIVAELYELPAHLQSWKKSWTRTRPLTPRQSRKIKAKAQTVNAKKWRGKCQ
jgi:mRNA-degrading endonuclease RelE of RelBE toxin-antitoxin system